MSTPERPRIPSSKRAREEAFRHGFAAEHDLGAMGGGQTDEPPPDGPGDPGGADRGRPEPDDDPAPSDRIERGGDAGRRGKVERQEGGGVGGGWS